MPNKIKVENLYRSSITSLTEIPLAGDFTFDVAVPPKNKNGYLIIGSENVSTRQIFYYHDVIGNTIYVRGINRINSAEIPVPLGYSVKMNDVAEIFNYYADNISTCFYIEKMGGLAIKVWGGYVMYNNAQQTVNDTSITLADNTTNYLKYDVASNTISYDTSATGNIKCEIVCASGIVTSVLYRVSKESYLDFAIPLTGALPSQGGNSGKALVTDGTSAYWGMPNGTRSGMQSNTTNDSLLVIGKSKLPIINGDFSVGSGTTLSGWVGQKSYGWYNSGGGYYETSYDSGRFKIASTYALGGGYVECRNTDGGYNGVTAESLIVEPNTTYTIEYDMETQYISGDSASGACVNVLFQNADGSPYGEVHPAFIKATTSSTHYSATITTGPNTRYCNISPIIYAHTGAGNLRMNAWFDNIVISCISNEILKPAPIASTVSPSDNLITEKRDGSFQKTPVSLLLPSFNVGIPAVESFSSTDLLSVVSNPSIATTPEIYYPVGQSSSNLITSIDCYSSGSASNTFQVWISKSAGLTSGNVSFRIVQSDGSTLVNANSTVTVAATSLTNNAANTITFPGSFSCGSLGTAVKFQACVNTFASPASSITNYFGLGLLKVGADSLGYYSGSTPEIHYTTSTYNGTFTVNKDCLLTKMDMGIGSITLNEDGATYITVSNGVTMTLPVLLKVGKTYTWSGSGVYGVGSFWRSGGWTNGPDIASMTQYMPEFGGGTQMFRVWNVYTAPVSSAVEYITSSGLVLSETIQRSQPYPKFFKNLIGYPVSAGSPGNTPKFVIGKKTVSSTSQGTTYYPSTNGSITTSVGSFIAQVGVGLPGNIIDMESPHGAINSYTYAINNTTGDTAYSNAFYMREGVVMNSTITTGNFVLQRWIDGGWSDVYTVSATGSKAFPGRGVYRCKVANAYNISVVLEII